MEPELSGDQEFFAATTRKFLDDKADVVVVRGLRHDERGYDAAFWEQGCELGWTSLLVSEEDGGGSISGSGLADLVLVAHEFGRHAAPGPLIATNVVAATLSRSGSESQKQEVLAGLLAGKVATWAHAEPPPNDRLGTVATEAVAAADGWSLTGTKAAVEAGASAEHLLVTARTAGGPTQFLLATDAEGVTVTPAQSLDLTRRFATVRFDGAVVPQSAVVGAVGDAGPDVQRQLQIANVLQCAEMVGAMDKAMEITIEWAFDRYSFGRPLASYQALKHRFADMKAWLEASHGLVDGAVRAAAEGEPGADELVSAAKAFVGHYGPELCHECVQMHGGIGVTFEHDMHLFLRRVVLDAAVHGTVTDHRLRLVEILEERDGAQEQAEVGATP
jgi:alkylation response protein AidB-like acyl-CoA dehydrogenase